MSVERAEGRAACLNLLVPGAGLILLGRIWLGVVVGLLFAASANYALWATLLVPDEFSRWARGLGIGLAGGTYFGAQLRLAQAVRTQARQRNAALRHEALAAVRERILRGDFAAALEAIEPVRHCAERDLLVTYRLAQVFTGMRHVDAGLRAWRRLRALDHHQIYRAEVCAGEQTLAGLRSARSGLGDVPPTEFDLRAGPVDTNRGKEGALDAAEGAD